ncbi:DnaJ C-terminal domain-containing protein, partial [Candidatus Omnitrophota bacterium]
FSGAGGGSFGGGIFEEIFSDLGFDFAGFSGQRRARGGGRRGRDLEIAANITLEEAFRGTQKSITVPRYESCTTCSGSGAKPGTKKASCPQCKGSGRTVASSGFGFQIAQTCPRCRGDGTLIQTPCIQCQGQGRVKKIRTIKVKVPPGVSTGSNLRIRGEGEQGAAGRGDLYVVIEVEPHNIFDRHNNDLVTEMTISLTQAILGSEIEVSTLNGRVRMKIPAGTQSGKVFRLKGKGMPDVHGGSPGDEFIKVDVKIPTDLNSSQRRIIEEFARESGESPGKKESLAEKLKKKLK